MVHEDIIMWISIAVIAVIMLAIILIISFGEKPAKPQVNDYEEKVARRKEIEKQIKDLVAIAVKTRDTLDKLYQEQINLNKWFEAYEVISKK